MDLKLILLGNILVRLWKLMSVLVLSRQGWVVQSDRPGPWQPEIGWRSFNVRDVASNSTALHFTSH